jgi:hypothetical protein
VDPVAGDVPAEHSVPHGLGMSAAVAVLGLASPSWMTVFNRTQVVHQEKLTDIVRNRPNGIGLLTVANHTTFI